MVAFRILIILWVISELRIHCKEQGKTNKLLKTLYVLLSFRRIPTCASIFLDEKRKWIHFAPQNDYDSPQRIESYFSSVATLMSLQLRGMVVNSLEDLLAFFMIYKVYAVRCIYAYSFQCYIETIIHTAIKCNALWRLKYSRSCLNKICLHPSNYSAY